MLARSVFFVLLGLSVALLSCSKDRPAPVAPAGKSLASLAAPPVPTNLRFDAPTDSSCTVRWDASDGATDYDVNYKPAVGGKWTNEPHRGVGLYNTIHDLQPNTEYRWAVRAENSDGASEWIHGPNFTTLPENQDGQDGGEAVSSREKPASPTNLRFDAPTDSSCTVRWDVSDGATDYDINYKLASGGRWINEPHAGDGLYNTIHDLQPNTEYRWAVRAENSNGASEWVFGPNFTTLPENQDGQDPKLFEIELLFTDNVPQEDQELFRRAAGEWEKIIIQGLFDIKLPTAFYAGEVFLHEGRSVDDLLLVVQTEPEDYSRVRFGIRAYANMIYARPGGLPALGVVTYGDESREILREQLQDEYDFHEDSNRQHGYDPWPPVEELVEQEMLTMAIHEIGHVLGLGTIDKWFDQIETIDFWADPTDQHMTYNRGTAHERTVEVSYFFMGDYAIRGFQQVHAAIKQYFLDTGNNPDLFMYYGDAIPLDENRHHWNFGLSELSLDIMSGTGSVSGQNGQPYPRYISPATLGALTDLGYAVDRVASVLEATPRGVVVLTEPAAAKIVASRPLFICTIDH